MLELVSVQFRGVAGGGRAVPLRRGGNPGEEIEPPEWRRDLPAGQQAAAAYVRTASGTLKVKARFRRSEAGEPATYRISARDATGANLLGAVGEVALTFAAGQTEASVEPPLTGAVAGTRVARHLDVWRWVAKKSPAGEDQEIALTTQVIYSLPGAPQAPWSEALDSATKWVWTSALDRACEWAHGAVTIEDACTLLAHRWHGLGKLPEGQRWKYLRSNQYTKMDGQLRLGLLLNDLAGPVDGRNRNVNCTDTAAAITALANALGAKLVEQVSNRADPSQPAHTVHWLGERSPRLATAPHDFAVGTLAAGAAVWDGSLVLVTGASTTPVHGTAQQGQGGYCATLWGPAGCTPPYKVAPRSMIPYPEESRVWLGGGVLTKRAGAAKDAATFYFHFHWSAGDLPGWELRHQRADAGEVRFVESDWRRRGEPERGMRIALEEWGSDEEAGAAFARRQSEYRGSFRLGQLGGDAVVWDDAGMGGILRIENLVIDVAMPVSEADLAEETVRSVWNALRGTRAGHGPSSVKALDLPLTNAAGEPLWYALTAERAAFARRGLHIELTTDAADTPHEVTYRAHTGANRFEQITRLV